MVAAVEGLFCVGSVEEMVQDAIAAANRVAEGPPVGTIARRPDGFWIAHMAESGWEYSELVTGTWRGSDADSWPVIFAPGEAVGSGPTTDGGETYDPREQSPREAAPSDGLPDVTAQQEPQVGGNLSEIPKSSTQQEPAERRAYLGPYEAPEEFTDGYTVDALFKERAKYWNRNDPATTHPVSPESTNCVPKPRTPRVVDRLGVDERGSRWHGAEGAAAYFHDGQSWRTNQGRVFAAGYQPDWNAPYTEILEPQPEAEGESSPKSSPRVLPSLDCEEARDGTVWEEPDGWRFWFNGEWRTDNGTRGRDLNLYQPSLLRLSTRSYTEVLPDVG